MELWRATEVVLSVPDEMLSLGGGSLVHRHHVGSVLLFRYLFWLERVCNNSTPANTGCCAPRGRFITLFWQSGFISRHYHNIFYLFMLILHALKSLYTYIVIQCMYVCKWLGTLSFCVTISYSYDAWCKIVSVSLEVPWCNGYGNERCLQSSPAPPSFWGLLLRSRLPSVPFELSQVYVFQVCALFGNKWTLSTIFPCHVICNSNSSTLVVFQVGG